VPSSPHNSIILETKAHLGPNLGLGNVSGEAGRHARLPQSFLLSKVVKTPSMVPTPPIEPTVGQVASTSHVVDTDVSSSAVL